MILYTCILQPFLVYHFFIALLFLLTNLYNLSRALLYRLSTIFIHVPVLRVNEITIKFDTNYNELGEIYYWHVLVALMIFAPPFLRR